MLTSTAE